MILPTLYLEKKLWKRGYRYVCGLDEVGRGSFAGPVVVGAVVFIKDCVLPEGIADSKLLKPRQREKIAGEIKKSARCWAVSEVGVPVINKVNIGKATQMAFRKAIRSLTLKPDYVIFDAFYNLSKVKISSSAYIKHLNRKTQMAVKGGDTVCASIAAASIIAKVHRDKLMKKLHIKYPNYGFAKHKGYGTKVHQEAIQKYGLCKVHRMSFNLSKFLI